MLALLTIICFFLCRTLRIDFNHSRLNYYTEIDAIMLCGRTVPMRCMHQLLAPAGKRLANTGEESGNGPIICKLRTLKFQPSCQGNDAVKLHEFINNDLSKFLMDSRVESEQQKNTSTTRICLTDLPVGQPICFTSSALHLMCKVFLVV